MHRAFSVRSSGEQAISTCGTVAEASAVGQASMRSWRNLSRYLLAVVLLFLALCVRASDGQQLLDGAVANRVVQPVCAATGNPRPTAVTRLRSVKMLYEVWYCVDLGITFMHIYKNAGTTILMKLRRFCKQTTGQEPIMFATWGDGPFLASLRDICSISTCFGFWREPVNRLLSGYHEFMRRNHLIKTRFKDLVLHEHATPSEKVAHFERFWTRIEKGTLQDGHVARQQDFLMLKGHNQVPGLAMFPLSRASSVLPMIFCGALAQCAPTAICPMRIVGLQGNRSRDRLSSDYGLKQYLIDETDLSAEMMRRVITFYRPDYCLLGIPMHPRGPAQFSCP